MSERNDSQRELEELRARVAQMEAQQAYLYQRQREQEERKSQAKAKYAPAAAFFKKYGLKVILPLALLLIACVTLIVCFGGLRGVYVSEEDPNCFFEFSVSKYKYIDENDEIEEGKWKISGGKLILTLQDEIFGEISEDFSFSRKGRAIFIDEEKFTRASIVKAKSAPKKTVTLSINGGTAENFNESNKVSLGSKLKEPANVEKRGYTFMGWFTSPNGYANGEEPFDFGDRVWEAKSLYACWEKLRCFVNLSQNIEGVGSVSGGGEKTFDSSVTIYANTQNLNYIWAGWYENGEKIASTLSYSFTITAANRFFEARWILNPITLTKNIGAAGSVSMTGGAYIGASTTITASTNAGYTWLGWYDGETKVSTGTSQNYTFTMSDTSKTYQARWIVCPVTLTKNIGAAGTVSGLENTALGASTTITASTNAGYTWLGWYDGETKVSEGSSLSYTFNMPFESKTFEARWEANSGTVSFDANGGEGAMSAVAISTGEQLPANAFTKTGYTFAGWALSADGEPVYTDGTLYVVTEDNSSCTLFAKWVSFADIYKRINASGVPDTGGSYILFGEYPQTIKAAAVTVGDAPDARGYYPGSDGYYYAKVTATPYSGGYKFSNDATVTSGTVYYFKVEPIKWRILSESGGTALILCESIIANKRYDDNSNNYMNSEIRAWLNNQFYNTAFTELQKQLILTTEVDNSAYSTGYEANPYACANTNDKIFLPSYRDMINTAYGFNSGYSASDTARRRITSDYSRATGAYMYTSSGYYGNGCWWLRSPSNYYGISARGVSFDGFISSSDGVDITSIGVVPALKIQLS